jgi:hypothetical protein
MTRLVRVLPRRSMPSGTPVLHLAPGQDGGWGGVRHSTAVGVSPRKRTVGVRSTMARSAGDKRWPGNTGGQRGRSTGRDPGRHSPSSGHPAAVARLRSYASSARVALAGGAVWRETAPVRWSVAAGDRGHDGRRGPAGRWRGGGGTRNFARLASSVVSPATGGATRHVIRRCAGSPPVGVAAGQFWPTSTSGCQW